MNGVTHISYVYGLADPLSGVIRYVGKSHDPIGRLKAHLRVKKAKTHKDNWLASLRRVGLLPELVILETTTSERSSECEIAWIAKFRSEGIRLTNGTDGGDGFGGYWAGKTHSPETRQKISKLRTGKKHSEAALAKMSHSQKDHKRLLGYKHSKEAKANMSKGQLGHVISDETRAKIAAGQRRAWELRRT